MEKGGDNLLSERLLRRVKEYLREQGVADDHEAVEIIELDMQVSTMGIIDYMIKNKNHVSNK